MLVCMKLFEVGILHQPEELPHAYLRCHCFDWPAPRSRCTSGVGRTRSRVLRRVLRLSDPRSCTKQGYQHANPTYPNPAAIPIF